MAAIASAIPTAPSRESVANDYSSNVSSPLSDVEDKEEETDGDTGDVVDDDLDDPGDHDTNNVAAEESDSGGRKNPDTDRLTAGTAGLHAKETTPEKIRKINLKKPLDLSSPSESLIDDVNDTEAETERLEETPRHPRRHNIIANHFGEGHTAERTPSSLRRTANPRDNIDSDHLSVSDNVSSPISQVADDSPTKPTNQSNAYPRVSPQESFQDRKRKRSPVVEQLDSDEPVRKRPGSVVGQDKSEQEEDATPTDADDENEHESVQDTNGERSVASGVNGFVTKKDPAPEEESVLRETRASKKSTRNGSKRASTTTTIRDEAAVNGGVSEEIRLDIGTEDDAVHPAGYEAAEVGGEDDADPEGKAIEEAEKKQAAYDEWSDIDEMFNLFRDRLYKDRLDQLDEEEQALLAEGHPEYLAMKQCLDEHYQAKIAHVQREYEMSLAAHAKKGEAQRSQIWGQFYQSVREKRERMLESLNERWYSIQESRRSAHRPPDRILVFPSDASRRERNSMAYNAEVQNLVNIAKHRGFPGAPPMRPATTDEINDDLQAMRRTRQPQEQQPTASVPSLDIQMPASFGGLGPAGKQFIKDNAWTNPKHPSHQMTQEQLRKGGSRSGSPFPSSSSTSLALSKATSGSRNLDKPAGRPERLKYDGNLVLASGRAVSPQITSRGSIFSNANTAEASKIETAVAASS